MKLIRVALPVLAIALVAGVLAAPALALPTGNLLANPGAEAPPVPDGSGLADHFLPPQGWTSTTPVEEGSYGAYDSCYEGVEPERNVLERSVGEAVDGGARFFFAGNTGLVTLQQEIPVTAEAAGRTLLIGGDIGGYDGQADHAALEANFLNSTGTDLGSKIVTPAVTSAERGEENKLLPREVRGTVPAGTSKIRIILIQTREEGSDNDGYADNLYATFDASAPAPPAATGDAACPLAAAPTPSPPAPAPVLPTPAPTPSVLITKGPAHETTSTGAAFSFTGTSGGTFECSLDGSAFKPCTSGRDLGPVAPGDHLFQVREELNGSTSATVGYRWTVDLPKACVLRVARARVFVYTKRDKARLVIRYTSYRAAKVKVDYKFSGSKGSLTLGSVSAAFSKQGVFRLPTSLSPEEIAKVRAAKSFQVTFHIAKTPASCGRYYVKKLTIPKKVSGQTVWFQSDSSFAPGS